MLINQPLAQRAGQELRLGELTEPVYSVDDALEDGEESIDNPVLRLMSV
jgi:hypothetical protein